MVILFIVLLKVFKILNAQEHFIEEMKDSRNNFKKY